MGKRGGFILTRFLRLTNLIMLRQTELRVGTPKSLEATGVWALIVSAGTSAQGRPNPTRVRRRVFTFSRPRGMAWAMYASVIDCLNLKLLG